MNYDPTEIPEESWADIALALAACAAVLAVVIALAVMV